MANPDRPRGFTPIKMLSGAPWAGNVRSVAVAAGTDIFLGDLLVLAAGLATPAATSATNVLGVAVGFGKRDKGSGQFASAYNPDNLTTLYYDDGASVAADWRVFYVPVYDMVFEAQSDAALSLAVGDPADLLATAGNPVTGRSAQEIAASVNGDVAVVEIPAFQDNDPLTANTRYWITVPRTNSVNH